jgi:hypothetical protein
VPYYEFWWDDRNLAKIDINGLTTDEVESVVCDPIKVDRSRRSGHPIAFGFAGDGRMIACVYEPFDELTVRPITAFYLESK